MKLQITQQDIDEGVIGEAEHCAIACALRRAGFQKVNVSEDWIEADRKVFQSDSRVVDFIRNFDHNNKDVVPTMLELNELILSTAWILTH